MENPKRDNFLRNMLTPPEKLENGQIWYDPDSKLEFLITDSQSSNEDRSVRAVVVSKVDTLSDGSDIILSPSDNDFLFVPRVALRLTDGPVPLKRLKSFRGKVKKEILKEIISSLNNLSFEGYNPAQLQIINALLDSLDPIRDEAIEEFEASYEEPETILEKIKNTASDFLADFLEKIGYHEKYQPNLVAGSSYMFDDRMLEENHTELFDHEDSWGLKLDLLFSGTDAYFVFNGNKSKEINSVEFFVNQGEDDGNSFLLEERMSVAKENENRRFFFIDNGILKNLYLFNTAITILTDNEVFSFEIPVLEK